MNSKELIKAALGPDETAEENASYVGTHNEPGYTRVKNILNQLKNKGYDLEEISVWMPNEDYNGSIEIQFTEE